MTIETDEKIAILATRSDSLAAGLSALLLSIPPIQQVKIHDDVAALVKDLATVGPALIIVDTTVIDPASAIHLRAIHDGAPRSLHVLLTEDMSEYRQLQTTTQDTVVIKGTDPAELASRLEQLLKARS